MGEPSTTDWLDVKAYPPPSPHHGYRFPPVRRGGGHHVFRPRPPHRRTAPRCGTHRGARVAGLTWMPAPTSTPSYRTPMRYPWWGKGGWAHLRLRTGSTHSPVQGHPRLTNPTYPANCTNARPRNGPTPRARYRENPGNVFIALMRSRFNDSDSLRRLWTIAAL